MTISNAASALFQTGELYFIDAVRAYQDRVIDPVLLEQVRGFIHQEAMHSKVHSECNAALAELFPGLRRGQKLIEFWLNVLRYLPRAQRLSLTCAFEHFTAIMGETLLGMRDLSVLPRAIEDMWRWHSAEEIEHKAVCFDVHNAVIGKGPLGYINRVFGMLFGTPLFLTGLLICCVMMGRGKVGPGGFRSAEAEPKSAAKVSNIGIFKRIKYLAREIRDYVPWRQYVAYYRPSFHPWQHDNSHLVVRWKQQYPGFGLT